MIVRVLFFGATASLAGVRSLDISLPDESTAETVLGQIKNKFTKLGSQRLLYSLNQTYATGDEIVRDGDEIAIFTAVSGG